MPFPDIHDSVYVSKETINGVPCSYFLHEDHNVRVHIYLDALSYAPVRLIQVCVRDRIFMCGVFFAHRRRLRRRFFAFL